MHETVVTVILLVSVMLVIEGISIITRLFINSGEESVLLNPVVIITPDDDAQTKLESLQKQLSWNNDGHIGTVVLVCDEENEELYECCSTFCGRNSGFELCEGSELKNVLLQLQKNRGK